MGWTAGVRFLAEERDFSLLDSVQTGSGSTQPPIYWVLGVVSPGVKRQGSEADYSNLMLGLRMVEL
jgi:hypothetical protein